LLLLTSLVLPGAPYTLRTVCEWLGLMPGDLLATFRGSLGGVADGTDVRLIAMSLPRTSEHLIRDYTKYRIGRIVYASVSPDETRLGFGFPKEERAALVASEPGKFMMPVPSDERYNWVRARLEAIEVDELRELLIDAWRMCVPKKVVAAYLESLLPAMRGWWRRRLSLRIVLLVHSRLLAECLALVENPQGLLEQRRLVASAGTVPDVALS